MKRKEVFGGGDIKEGECLFGGGDYLSGGRRRGGWVMRRVRLKGSTLGFIDLFGKEKK